MPVCRGHCLTRHSTEKYPYFFKNVNMPMCYVYMYLPHGPRPLCVSINYIRGITKLDTDRLLFINHKNSYMKSIPSRYSANARAKISFAVPVKYSAKK